MKLLLHTCCAPCSIMPVEKLLAAGYDVTAYFYNPNIHPYREYKQRRNTFVDYMAKLQIKSVVDDDYALEEYLGQVAHRVDTRCEVCYKIRLQKAAEYARNNGFDDFSTTLLVSIYQNQDLIRTIGEEIGKTCGVPFVYEDFRPFFRDGQAKARELELYMQSYCGCIYSEKDRYWKPKKQNPAAK